MTTIYDEDNLCFTLYRSRNTLCWSSLPSTAKRWQSNIFIWRKKHHKQYLKWSSRPSSSSPSSPSPPPSSSSPPPSPPGWPRRFQPVLLLLDRLHLLPRPDCHWQEQVSVIFFSTFHKQFVFVFVFVFTFCLYLYLYLYWNPLPRLEWERKIPDEKISVLKDLMNVSDCHFHCRLIPY